jgi:hypothetical protein
MLCGAGHYKYGYVSARFSYFRGFFLITGCSSQWKSCASPSTRVDDMLKGFVKAHSDLVAPTDNPRVLRSSAAPKRGKVGVVTGGGSRGRAGSASGLGEPSMQGLPHAVVSSRRWPHPFQSDSGRGLGAASKILSALLTGGPCVTIFYRSVFVGRGVCFPQGKETDMRLRRFAKILLALAAALVFASAVATTAFACTPETDDYPPPTLPPQ